MVLGRISFRKTHSDIRNTLYEQKKVANNLTNQLSTQNRIQELRDDPASASHGTRYSSLLSRKEVFVKQNRRTYDVLQTSEGYIRQIVDIMQNSRELTVRAANGTFTKKDRKLMAGEINQMIEELLVVANAQDGDGRYLFGGTRTDTPPFVGLRTASVDMNKDVINTVEYLGNNQATMAEVSDQDIVQSSIPGSDLLWSQKPQLYGNTEASGFALSEDSSVIINGTELHFSQGDSIYAIIDKINRSTIPVSASLAPIKGEFVISSNASSQLWINDTKGSLFKDLGLINNNVPPNNIADNATLFEETVFGSLISLRDAMFSDNYENIGGRVLGAMDSSMGSILDNLGKIGAITERLDLVHTRLYQKDIPNITRQMQNELSIDIPDTIVQWRSLQQTQQASYAVSSQIMQNSLLNYLH